MFSTYVDFLLTNGYPIEFFHEGGRSRIGKLLPPKTGLTSMCVSSILKRRAENTFICPVYISYDKVMEDDAYARELSGAKKETESFWQLIKSLRFLFSTYGRVEVAFGTPIRFGDYWSDFVRRIQQPIGSMSVGNEREQLPDNLADLRSDFDLRDSRIQALVRDLSRKVNQGINSSATASDTALLASVILAQPSGVDLQESDCLRKVAVLRRTVSELGASLGWLISSGSPTTTDSMNKWNTSPMFLKLRWMMLRPKDDRTTSLLLRCVGAFLKGGITSRLDSQRMLSSTSGGIGAPSFTCLPYRGLLLTSL